MKSNEKLKETLQPLVDEIVAGLSEETLDYLYEHGHEELISFEELSKLFKETFGLNKEYLCILTILTPILMMLTPSKRAGLSKSSLCLRANRQQRSCKDITFSFS